LLQHAAVWLHLGPSGRVGPEFVPSLVGLGERILAERGGMACEGVLAGAEPEGGYGTSFSYPWDGGRL
jgi:hypothetical protein